MEHASIGLGNFEHIIPPFLRKQSELVEWTARAHQEALPLAAGTIEKLFHRYSVSSEKVSRRAFECPDIENTDQWAHNRIYRFDLHHPEGVSISARNAFFSERAQSVFETFYPAQAKLPDHLIHVTCTGYVSPSAAQQRVAGHTETAVTHAYHMGCYAALPAVRMAEAFVRCSEKKNFSADIVHTEMCGLHMNAADHSPEQIVVQTLFADGHIKYSVKKAAELNRGFRILQLSEEIVPGSAGEMRWIPSSWGMQMTLSRAVPELLAENLRPFLTRLFAKANLSLAESLKSAIFAVHPGGPKIIESVRGTLELSKEQTAASETILFERGNMSSATLPHVWEEISNQNLTTGTKVVSLAFGPGLTIFGAVFESI